MEHIIVGKVLRWGNSYALRLSKRDVERFGWREGTTLRVEEVDKEQDLDLDYPTWRSGHADTATNHDEVLYGWPSDA